MTKIQQRLQADPRVQEVWSEESSGDGMWVALRPGFIDDEAGVHCIHEWTWTEVREKMKDVRPCDCADCRKP